MPVTAHTHELVREHLAHPSKTDYMKRIESEHRIPAVHHLWPRMYWLACLVCPAPGEVPGYAEATDDELRMLTSYMDYKLTSVYRDEYVRAVRELPLPLVAGHNTTIFVKREEDGWGYKAMSWESGSWPHSYRSMRKPEDLPDHPLSLVEIIDKIETTVDTPRPAWVAWKEEHPDVFAAVTV